MELGVILTPTTLVGLLAPLFGLSAQISAACAITTVVIVSVILYRQKVNDLVPSAIPLALVIVITLWVPFLKGRKSTLSTLDEISIIPRANDYLSDGSADSFASHLDSSKDEVWMVGTSFYIHVAERSEALLEALQRGVDVHYLVFDFTSSLSPAVSENFNIDLSQFRNECRSGLHALMKLREDWMQNRGNSIARLEIRLYQSFPSGRAYVFDPQGADPKYYFVPYMNRTNSAENPGFLLKGRDDSPLLVYFRGIEKTWGTAMLLDDWIKENPEFSENIEDIQ